MNQEAWQLRPRDEVGDVVWEQAMQLQARQGTERRAIGEASLVLYFGNGRHSTGGRVADPGDLMADMGTGVNYAPSQNIIQMVVDTIVSHTIRNRVRPFFLTERGKVDERERAMGMMRAVEGIFMDQGIYADLGLWVAQAGYLWDGGLVKVIADYARNRITLQRVYPWEWLIPEREGAFGDPWQGFHVYAIDRQELLAEYEENADAAKAIRDAQPVPREFVGGDETGGQVSDMVLVVEAYHRPTKYVDLDDEKSWGMKDGKVDSSVDCGHDGRRVVMVQDFVLTDEPWPLELPVAEFFPARNPSDYWSRGVPETLAGAQMKIDEYQQRKAEILHRHAVPWLVMWKAAKLKRGSIANDTARVFESQVAPSQALYYLQNNAVPGELIAEQEKIVQWALAQYGLNEMSLYGEKPPGIEHAPGMEHLLEEQNMRHTQKFRAWENFHIKLARLVVEHCRLMALKDKQFEIMWGDAHDLRREKWRDVDLDRGKFITKIWAANLLPQTPGMKMARLEKLVTQGILTPELARTQLGEEYPDVEALLGDAGSGERAIRKMLDKVVRGGMNVNTFPNPFMNIAMAKQLATDRINALIADDAEQRYIDNVQRFWEVMNEYELRQTNSSAQATAGELPPAQALPPAPPPVEGVPPGAPIQ